MTTTPPNFLSLIERIEKLERQNRKLKQWGIVVLVLIAALVLMGQARPPRTVEANEFVLKDDSGRVRGRFHMKDGGTELVLLDPRGIASVWVAQRFEGGYSIGLEVGIADDLGKTRALLHTNEITPELSFLDGDGLAVTSLAKNRISFYDGGNVEIYGHDGGAIGFGINERPGTPLPARMRPPISKDMEAALEGLRKEAERRHPGAYFQLLGPNGKLILQADKAQGSALMLSDKEGFRTEIGTSELITPRTGETRKTSAASVVMSDKDGKVLWRDP